MKTTIKDGMIAPATWEAHHLGFDLKKFSGYLWKEGNLITISLITSLQPNKGNVKELFDRIKSLGYEIFVPCPSNRMRSICAKRGMIPTLLTDADNESCEGMMMPEIK